MLCGVAGCTKEKATSEALVESARKGEAEAVEPLVALGADV